MSDPFDTPSGAAAAIAASTPKQFGHFHIFGRLGHGGMGVVLDARTPDGTAVALKLIRPSGDPDRMKVLSARLLREAKILRKLSHPGVVRLVDSGSVHGILYLAMERIEGKSLGTVMKHGALDAEVVLSIGIKIGDTLAHLHEIGIVHRDIKPDNVIIDTQGRPILTDFGLSRLSGATAITKRDELVGSLGYIAPEIVDGAQPSASSDQYALGRLLFNMAVGPQPEEKDNIPILEQLAKSLETDWSLLPRGGKLDPLARVVRRMVSSKEQDRYPDMYACVVDLNAALAGEPLLEADVLPRYDSVPTDKHGVVSPVIDEPRAPGPRPDVSSPPDPERPGEARNWEDDTKFAPAPDLSDLVARLGAPVKAPWLATDLGAPAALPLAADLAIVTPVRKDSDAGRELATPEVGAPPFMPDDVIAVASDTNDLILRMRHKTQLSWSSDSPPAGSPAPSGPGPLDLFANAKTEKSEQIALLRQKTQAFWRSRLEEPDPPEPAVLPRPAVPSEDPSLDIETDEMKRWEADAVSAQPPLGNASFSLPLLPAVDVDAPEVDAPEVEAPSTSDLPGPAGADWTPLIPYPQAESELNSADLAPGTLDVAPERERSDLPAPARRRRSTLIAALAAVLVAAVAAAFTVTRGGPDWPEGPVASDGVPLVAPPQWEGQAVAPIFRYLGSPPPPESNRTIALSLYAEAKAAISRRDLAAAERFLGLCIRAADLPDCHKALGSVAAIARRPASRTHYEHYLRHAESEAEDAKRVRSLLSGEQPSEAER